VDSQDCSQRPSARMSQLSGGNSKADWEKFIKAAKENDESELRRLYAAGVHKHIAVVEHVCFIYCSVAMC
jgi:hypothetical protein